MSGPVPGVVPGPAAKAGEIRAGPGQRRGRGRPPTGCGRAIPWWCAVPAPSPSHLAPEALPLTILFEDRDLLVVNKPPGLVVHPGAGHRQGTLLNALVHHCPDLKDIGEVSRPGLVHRLDKDTSGLIGGGQDLAGPRRPGGPVPGPHHHQALPGPGLGAPAGSRRAESTKRWAATPRPARR